MPPAAPPPPEAPAPGGALRLVAPDRVVEPVPWGLHGSADVLLAGAVFEGLVALRGDGIAPSVASGWERQARPGPPAGAQETWVFRLDGPARFASGAPVEPADVVRSWERLLRSPLSPYRFLLDPVVGARAFRDGEAPAIAGLEADGMNLRVSLRGATPDWLLRLSHPALGIARGDPPDGTGPFAADPDSAGMRANPYHSEGPFLDRVTLVERTAPGAPLLLAAREVDAVVAFGREAGEIARDPRGASLRRLPGSDRTYAVVVSPRARPLAEDDALRAALAAAIEHDRGSLVSLLFDGRGAPVASLLPAAPLPGPADWIAPEVRPGTVSLTYDRDDPLATSVAARVKAGWDQRVLRTRLDGIPTLDLAQRLQEGAFEAALLLHRPPVDDPVLALRGALPAALAGLPDFAASLDAAARLAEPEPRLAAARHAESLLTRRALLVPVVRLHAWLVADPQLLLPGEDRLDLAASGWRP